MHRRHDGVVQATDKVNLKSIKVMEGTVVGVIFAGTVEILIYALLQVSGPMLVF